MASRQPVAANRHHGSSPPIGQRPYLKNKQAAVDSSGESDECLSDDELFANFNATSSNKSSQPTKNVRNPYSMMNAEARYPQSPSRRPHGDDFLSQQENPMMMTMKKPWQPSSSKRSNSSGPYGQGGKLGALDESDSGASSDEELSRASKKPSFLRSQQRPKSPSVHGRQGSLPKDDDHPQPTPRQRNQPERVLDRDNRSPISADRKSPYGLEERSMPLSRKTPTNDRISPVNQRKSPKEDRDPFGRDYVDYGSRHKDDRLSSPSSYDHKTPMEDRRFTTDRRSPHREGFDELDYEDSAKYRDRQKRTTDRHGLSFERKSPAEEKRFGTGSNRQSPQAEKNSCHASPKENRQTPVRPSRRRDSEQRRGSVLDYLTGDQRDSSDEEKRRIVAPKSGSTYSQGTKSTSPGLGRPRSRSSERGNPFEKDHRSPRTMEMKQKKKSSKRSQRPSSQNGSRSGTDKEVNSDGESSVCEETIEEPAKKDSSDKDQNEDASESPKPRQQRSSHQKSDETIEMVKGAQQESSRMRFIDPAKSESKADDSVPPTSSSSVRRPPGRVYKPKPRYGKPNRSSSMSDMNFESTVDIRNEVYNQWKKTHAKQINQQKQEKEQKEKEAEDAKTKERQERLENGRKAYEVWKESKKDYVSERQLKKKKEEERAKMEEEKKRQKKEEAALVS